MMELLYSDRDSEMLFQALQALSPKIPYHNSMLYVPLLSHFTGED